MSSARFFPAPTELPPALPALGMQLVATALALVLVGLLDVARTPMSLGQFALTQGFTASLLSYARNEPRWWQVIHLVFAPALLITHALHLPAIAFAIGFVFLLLIMPDAVRTRVPLYLSSREAITAVACRLPQGRAFTVFDAGAGTGRFLAGLAAGRNDGQYVGLESAPLTWLIARLRLRRDPRCHIRQGNLWHEDLGHYDVVYAFLSPEPMPKLWEKVQREMRPGSLFISNSFEIPGVPADEVVPLGGTRQTALYLWRR